MTFYAYPTRSSRGKQVVELVDVDKVAVGDTEDDAVIEAASNVDFNVHTGIVVLNSETYEMKEYEI